jgi:hypothetical protein
MEYVLILDEGVVLDSNGEVVAPCESASDPRFVEYIRAVRDDGVQPRVIETRADI